VRHVKGRNPVRAILDRDLSLLATLKIFENTAPVLVFNEQKNAVSGHIEYVKIEHDEDALDRILKILAKRGLESLIVEGGAETLAGFAERGLWDEARIFKTTHVLGSGKRAPVLEGDIVREEAVGEDQLLIIKKERN